MSTNLFIQKENKQPGFVLMNVLILITMLTSVLLFNIHSIQLEVKNIQLAKEVALRLIEKRKIFEELYNEIEKEKWKNVYKSNYSFEKIDDFYIVVNIEGEKFKVYHEFEEEKK